MHLRSSIVGSILSILFAGSIVAQPGDSGSAGVSSDSLRHRSGLVYTVSGTLSFVTFTDRSALVAGGGAGVFLGERFMIEAGYSTMIDRFSKRVIFPEVYRFRMWSAGLEFRYNMVAHRTYYVYAALNGSFAQASWTPTESRAVSFVDHVYMLAPGCGAGLRVLPFVAIEAGMRYNTAFGFELVGLEDDALDGIEFDVGIRFSYPSSRKADE